MLTARARATRNAVYNSRIPGMLTPTSSWFIRSLLVVLVFVLVLLLAATACAQNWPGAEEQLASKIVAATGPKTIAVEVSNRSSLSTASVDGIRRGLLTQLAALGLHFVNAEQAAAMVHVSLSEDLQSFVWVAEIHQGANVASVVMVSLPRPETQSVEPEAAAMVLRRVPLWSQHERILDVATIEGNPARMVVLDSNGLVLYRQQEGHWLPEQSVPIAHSRPWPRDLRGRLALRKDHLLDAYLPGVFCRSTSSAPLAMTCYDSDEPWPIGTDLFSLNAPSVASRNFFTGSLSPGVGKPTVAPAFYSAAALPRDKYTFWLLATVDGQVHLLDGTTDQVLPKLGWGSEIAGLRSGCGSGWQVLATGNGDGSGDTVRAFEVPDREPIAASPTLELTDNITAMWTESGGTGVVVVARNSETGRYEAFRLTVICGR
jgi:hypothetical protein